MTYDPKGWRKRGNSPKTSSEPFLLPSAVCTRVHSDVDSNLILLCIYIFTYIVANRSPCFLLMGPPKKNHYYQNPVSHAPLSFMKTQGTTIDFISLLGRPTGASTLNVAGRQTEGMVDEGFYVDRCWSLSCEDCCPYDGTNVKQMSTCCWWETKGKPWKSIKQW